MRIPVFVAEHPVESLIACVLLLALLFGPTDRFTSQAANASAGGAQVAYAERL